MENHTSDGETPPMDSDLTLVSDHEDDCGKRFVTRHRRLVGVAIPALLVQFIWVCLMVRYDLWYLFAGRYPLTITMAVASVLAGLTSIGGGAIAFPVLTLILNVTPEVARDFALLIQSCGMTCAAFTIFFMGVPVETWSLLLCSIGGGIGLIFGLEYIEGKIQPAWKKMIFSSFWFSFAFALHFLNRTRNRKLFISIPKFCWWKGLVLVLTGVIGGIFTSFVGAGLDICCLSVLTLFFRVSEKAATPTSVILMGFNSILGSFWRGAMMTAITHEAWEYLAVAAVVVVIGAPIGSILGTCIPRQAIAWIIYILVTLTLVTALYLVPQTPALASVSVSMVFVGLVVFFGLTWAGKRLAPGTSPSEVDEEEDRKSDVSSVYTLEKEKKHTLYGSDTTVIHL